MRVPTKGIAVMTVVMMALVSEIVARPRAQFNPWNSAATGGGMGGGWIGPDGVPTAVGTGFANAAGGGLGIGAGAGVAANFGQFGHWTMGQGTGFAFGK